MNEDILKAIHQELVAIRQLLAETKQAQARSTPPTRATSSSSSSTTGDTPPPQPTEIVANPGDVQVHFGKNTGIALSKLSERQLSWYAQEPAPRLDSSGNPYPVRPQETTLRNAARTLWHQNRGTLGQAEAPKYASEAGAASESQSHPSDEETRPF